ncbi:nodal homolog 2-A-like [Discoglossus pictus]
MALPIIIFCFSCNLLVQGIPTISLSENSRIALPPFNMRLKASSSLHKTSHAQGMKRPLHMMQLYQTLIHGKNTDISTLEHHVLQESDSVLGLNAKSFLEEGNIWKLSFDLSSLSISNELRLVELRISFPSFDRSHNLTVNIYHYKELKETFIGSLEIDHSPALGSLRKTFNVTKLLQSYLYQDVNMKNDNNVYAKDMPESVWESKHRGFKALTTDPSQSFGQAMLLVFAKDKPFDNKSESPSLIKDVQASKYVIAENDTRMTGIRRHRRNHIMFNNIPSRPLEDGKPLCRRVDMIVDFEKIGWGDYIVYPKSYNVYRCEGACPIPLNQTFNPTNHAYIKSLVNFYDPERVECPSCVPIKLKPLSMLMYDDDGEVELRRHDDMVVEDYDIKKHSFVVLCALVFVDEVKLQLDDVIGGITKKTWWPTRASLYFAGIILDIQEVL